MVCKIYEHKSNKLFYSWKNRIEKIVFLVQYWMDYLCKMFSKVIKNIKFKNSSIDLQTELFFVNLFFLLIIPINNLELQDEQNIKCTCFVDLNCIFVLWLWRWNMFTMLLYFVVIPSYVHDFFSFIIFVFLQTFLIAFTS